MAYYLDSSGLTVPHIKLTNQINMAVGDSIKFDFVPLAGNKGGEYRLCGQENQNAYEDIFGINDSGILLRVAGVRATLAAPKPPVGTRVEVELLRASSTQYEAYYDGVLQVTFNTSGSLPIDTFYDYGQVQSGFYCELYSIKYNDGADHLWDPSASNGTGSTLPDTAGANDGTLVNFPADDSQWVFYSASTGVTGTADHQASTATHTATGSVSSTITGTADHQATTATQAATGTREVTATGNHQAQAAAHSASGSVGSAITGTASHQATAATHSATAEREITGTGSSQATRAAQSATGLRVVTGDAVHQAGAATHSAQGAAGNAFVGSGDHQAQTSTHAATGTREVTGTSTGQAQTATHNAMAVREIIGSGTHAANDATHSSTGTISRTITGTASHQAQRATHQASSRPVLLRPIKNTSLVEVTPDYSTVDISQTYTIAVQ